MSKHTRKAQLLSDIKTQHRRLEDVLIQLSQDTQLIPGVIGHWSVKDILAHLSAWEQLFIGWYHAGDNNEIPQPSPVGMSRKSIDQLNQWIFEIHQQDSLDQVWLEFRASYQQTLEMIESIPEEDIFSHARFAWTGKWTLADYIAGNTCNHYRWAKSKIQAWLTSHNKSCDEDET